MSKTGTKIIVVPLEHIYTVLGSMKHEAKVYGADIDCIVNELYERLRSYGIGIDKEHLIGGDSE